MLLVDFNCLLFALRIFIYLVPNKKYCIIVYFMSVIFPGKHTSSNIECKKRPEKFDQNTWIFPDMFWKVSIRPF